MLEFLIAIRDKQTKVLFDFDSTYGVQDTRWYSKDVETELWAESAKSSIQVEDNGVVFDGVAANRLKMNRVIKEPILSFIAEVFINTNATGRTGILLGNFNDAPNRNIEFYNNNRFRVYGPPGELVFTESVPKGILTTVGFTVDVNKKQYTYYRDGERVQVANFSGTASEMKTPFYIGADTRTTYPLQGRIKRMMGLANRLSESAMLELTKRETT